MSRCSAFLSFLLLLPLLLAPSPTSAQSEGDVRLAGAPSHPTIGRLEIYWHGEWSTFCGLSTGGAQAACRQMGFLDFVQYKPLYKVDKSAVNISEASPDTPISIDYTKCNRTFTNGLLHVLRCGYSTKPDSSCNHSNDTVLKCEPTSLWTHPYDTQVRLNTTGSATNDTHSISSGILEIFVKDKWGNVCANEFTQASADSACRQMGYTNALTNTSVSQGSTSTVWLDKVTCGEERSCNCLSGCFTGKTPTTPTTCPKGQFVNITCTYDVDIQDKVPAGSQNACDVDNGNEASCTGTGHGGDSSSPLAPGAVGAIVVVVFLLVVGMVVMGGALYWVIMSRRRGSYDVIKN